jgi:hypothetical protein
MSLTGNQAVMVIEIRAQSTCGFFVTRHWPRHPEQIKDKLPTENRF